MENELTLENELQLMRESRLKLQETERMLKDLFLATDKKFQDTDKKFQDTDKKFQETDRMITNLGKEIGGLGKSIGNIAEGLSYPSLANELIEKFNVEFVAPNVEKRMGNEVLELDVFAYSNSTKNELYVIEIKTNLNETAIEQLSKSVNKIKKFFPEHKDKKVYGIICAIKASKKLREEVQKKGFYFATVKDGFFKIIEQPKETPVKSF